MKPPLCQPDWTRLLSENQDTLGPILDLPMPKGYPHWDKIARLAPPNGATAERWWLAIKLRRRSQARPTPMRDVAGNAFTYTLPDELLEGLHHIDQMAAGRVASPQSVLSAENRARFVISGLLEEAITSSQLEGASTTRKVAAEMLRSGRSPRDRSERMILNNFQAMGSVRALQSEPMTTERLLRLHRQVTEDTLEHPGAAGRLQQVEEERVHIEDNRTGRILYKPPAAEHLKARFGQLVAFANADRRAEEGSSDFLHPVLHAILLHFWVGFDHPFEDGNGRLARALFYWSMLRQGYWLFEYISISNAIKEAPGKYARAYLHTETDGNDLTYFFLNQIGSIRRAISKLQDYLARKAEQADRVKRLIRQDRKLNHRQVALLAHAIGHPGFRYTTRSHKDSHGISYATARSDLHALVDRGLLGQGQEHRRKAVFIAPENLEDRLRA